MSEQTVSAPPPKKRRPPVGLLLVLLLAGGGYFIWKNYVQQPPVPANLVVLSGRIEGDDSTVAPKVSGRIAEIRFREGDTVKAGDIIAVMDDVQARSREDQVKASISEAEARVHLVQQQVAILEDQLRQADLSTDQSRVDANARVLQAEAEISAAEAQLAQQQASLKLAAWDREAYTKLAKDGAVSDRQGRLAAITAWPSTSLPSLRLSLICAVVLMSSRARITVSSLTATLTPPTRSAAFSRFAIQRAAPLDAPL